MTFQIMTKLNTTYREIRQIHVIECVIKILFLYYILYLSLRVMDDLKLLAAYSLFGINTISNPNLSMLSQRQIASTPFFGVFVSLYRNENVVSMTHDKIHTEERQIHGCLGHWNPKYQSMSPLDLIEKCSN